MRILIFIMFVIMIIIFLNELKNITLSFLKINYLKDVADINIKKHCNNIYCEAETGRFNLAKNSYDLLLPNDNFNTKTYYYTILFVIVLLFIDLMYKFWKYNDLFIPYLSNINGEYFITYLKLFPYILSFLIVFILTVMIIRRYAPTSSKGYKAYFNTDNDVIPDDIDTFNINVILNQSKNIIIIFLILYLICGFLSSIPSVPHDSRIDGQNYFYFAMAYIFILLLCFYMMVNIINITMTFTDNDKPKLEYIDIREILKSEVEELHVLNDDKMRSDIKYEDIKDFFKKKLSELNIVSVDVFWVIENVFKGNLEEIVVKFAFEEIDKYFKENAGRLKDLKDKYEIEGDIIKFLKDKADEYEIEFPDISHIPEITENVENVEIIISTHGSTDGSTHGSTDGLFITLLDTEIKTLKEKSVTNDTSIIMLEKLRKIVKKDGYFNKLNRIVMICNLTNLLIYKNLVNVLNTDLYNEYNINKSDVNKFKELYKDYLKQKQKINLFNDISHMKKEYSNIKNISNKIANGFVDKYEEKLTYCIELLGKANEPNNNLLYSQEYSIFKNTYEADQTYTVDTSYNSKNKYYENYFKIANGEKLHGDYNIGEYKIKNMEDLLSYIMFVIILSLVLLLMIYNITTNTNTFNSYNLFTSEIITPFLLMFIFVLFIYIFINYNTKYNLYFINGIFDSCYKRDLTHLNNKLIPFIKLHDKNADIISNDYLDHYIITNVFTSIINGDLILEATGKYENPLKLDKKFKDYATMSSMNVQFKLYNDIDTSDKVNFDNYYSKIYEETYSYFKGDNKDFKKNSNPDIYTFVESIPENPNIKNIVDKTVTNSSDIDDYFEHIINSYKDKIIKIIYICKHIFNPNNFKKNISEYNDDITNNNENILMSYFKFELSENKMEAIPYKFLLNINANNLDDFLKLANDDKIILPPEVETKEEKALKSAGTPEEKYIALLELNESYKPIEKIVNNFLLIIAHMKYNYEILKKHIPDLSSINTIANPSILEVPMSSMINADDNPELKNALHKLHWYENIKLFGLLTDSLYKNNNTKIEIADTFNPTFKPDETKGTLHKIYTELNYTFNMLNNYESETNNISNNYLKNVIKSIYKDINNSDIKFHNDDSDGKFEFKIDKSNLADPVDSILHKANNITGEGFLINYITNIIIIIMMYNIGNNI